MTRLPSAGWSFGMSSGSARNCLQRNRLFRQSADGAVIWRRPLVTPSFTTRSYGRCASFLKATWSASSMESSLSWKPDSIRSFAADYGRRLKSARVAEQRVIKDKLDRVVLAGDS